MFAYLNELLAVFFTIWTFPVRLAFRVCGVILGALGLVASGEEQISNSKIHNKNSRKPLQINGNYITDTEMERQHAMPGRSRHQNAGLQGIRTKQEELKQPQQPQKNREGVQIQKCVPDISQRQSRLKDNLEEKPGGWKLENITTTKIEESKTLPKPVKEETTSVKTNGTLGGPPDTATRAQQEQQQQQQRQELQNEKYVSDAIQQKYRFEDNALKKQGGWKLEIGTGIQTIEGKTVPGLPNGSKEEATSYKTYNVMDDPRIAQIAAKYRAVPKGPLWNNEQEKSGPQFNKPTLLQDEGASEPEKPKGSNSNMTCTTVATAITIDTAKKPPQSPKPDVKSIRTGPQVNRITSLKDEWGSEPQKPKESDAKITSTTGSTATAANTGNNPPQSPKADLKSPSSPKSKRSWTLPRRGSNLTNSPFGSRRGSFANADVASDSEGVLSDASPSASPRARRKSPHKRLLKSLQKASQKASKKAT